MYEPFEDDNWLSTYQEIPVTRNEILMISDFVTISVTRNISGERESGKIEIPYRGLKDSANAMMEFHVIMNIFLAVSTRKNSKLKLQVGDWIILREACNSRVKYGNENVGKNLLLKICKCVSDAYKKESEIQPKISKKLKSELKELLNKNNEDFNNKKKEG
tara:strand:- start:4524 stop:5006 length:483 start_codon:yes stop_codon:yes gene_type:complete